MIQSLLGVDVGVFPRMTYDEAIRRYGNDKPYIRFGMEFAELNSVAQGKGFVVFDSQELVVSISVPEQREYTRKQIDALIDWVKRLKLERLA